MPVDIHTPNYQQHSWGCLSDVSVTSMVEDRALERLQGWVPPPWKVLSVKLNAGQSSSHEAGTYPSLVTLENEIVLELEELTRYFCLRCTFLAFLRKEGGGVFFFTLSPHPPLPLERSPPRKKNYTTVIVLPLKLFNKMHLVTPPVALSIKSHFHPKKALLIIGLSPSTIFPLNTFLPTYKQIITLDNPPQAILPTHHLLNLSLARYVHHNKISFFCFWMVLISLLEHYIARIKFLP